jgi:hypothetical protein
MRRPPAAAWVLAPLALALLYVAGHALLAPTPTLANLPPPDAVLVQRFRDLDTFDRDSFGPRGPQARLPHVIVGEERNVPGLPGVDPDAPIHLVLLPRGTTQDASMVIFRLKDRAAFRRAFLRTDSVERHLVRHAQHLALRDGWAAVGPERDATRRIGMGRLTCADLGESWSIAADVPGLVQSALDTPRQYPWHDLLVALGVQPGKARFVHLLRTDELRVVIPGAERPRRLGEAWKTARLWAWMDTGRLRADLEPQPGGPVAAALAAASAAGAAPTRGGPPQAPSDAVAWLRVPRAADRPLLAHALYGCGLRFVTEGKDVDPLGGLGTPPAAGQEGLLLWAVHGVRAASAWTVGLAAPHGSLPPLGAFLPAARPGGDPVELPAGAAPLTRGATAQGDAAPAGHVEAAAALPWAAGGGPVDAITFGPGAHGALEGLRAHLGLPSPPRVTDERAAWDPGPGMRSVATFVVRAARARALLGRALEPGGFLAVLRGGDLHGALYTDGHLLRLQVRVAR